MKDLLDFEMNNETYFMQKSILDSIKQSSLDYIQFNWFELIDLTEPNLYEQVLEKSSKFLGGILFCFHHIDDSGIKEGTISLFSLKSRFKSNKKKLSPHILNETIFRVWIETFNRIRLSHCYFSFHKWYDCFDEFIWLQF